MGGLFYKQQMIQKGADEKTGKQKYDLNKLSLITRNIIFILHSLSLSVCGVSFCRLQFISNSIRKTLYSICTRPDVLLFIAQLYSNDDKPGHLSSCSTILVTIDRGNIKWIFFNM